MAIAAPLSIELNGDSILNGYGVDITPVQRIQAARPWWTLDDRCINGLRLQKLMLTFADVPHNSRVTVIALGANDGFGLVPPDEYRADLPGGRAHQPGMRLHSRVHGPARHAAGALFPWNGRTTWTP